MQGRSSRSVKPSVTRNYERKMRKCKRESIKKAEQDYLSLFEEIPKTIGGIDNSFGSFFDFGLEEVEEEKETPRPTEPLCCVTFGNITNQMPNMEVEPANPVETTFCQTK